MIVIAVTGGIGSGKSEVLRLLKEKTANVISADRINGELLRDAQYVARLGEYFPEAVNDGVVNKMALFDIITHDDGARETLNSLAHPLIQKRITDVLSKTAGDFVFVEIPLLIESNLHMILDKVWLVSASYGVREARALIRENMDKEKFAKIASVQVGDEELMKYATDVIHNDGSIEELREKVEQAYNGLWNF